jgi:hypothetical protein
VHAKWLGGEPPRATEPVALPSRRSSAPASLRNTVTLPAMIGVGVLLGALYAVGMAIRGDLVPGLVGGALAAVLCVLVLREVEARRRRRNRR